MLVAYLTDIMILLCAAVLIVPLCQALKIGSIPGFLIAGILVGPSVLGLIDNISEIAAFSEFGVVLLLFIIGIELKPSQLWRMRRLVFGLGSLQILLTGGVIAVLMHHVLAVNFAIAILIGMALALSSTSFVLQILIENKTFNTQFGRTSFAILLMQDLAVVPLLALVTLLTMSQFSLGMDILLSLLQSLLILGIVIFGGRYLLHPILHRVALAGSPEVFTSSAVLLVLSTAILTEHLGMSMAMGAFLAGMLIGDSSYRHQVMAEIQPFRGLLLGLFFMSMGMSLNLNYLIEHPVQSLFWVIALLTLKIIILLGLLFLFGERNRPGLAIALLLGQSGEFALALFSIARQKQLLIDSLYQPLLLVVLLSMLITPLLAVIAHRLHRQS